MPQGPRLSHANAPRTQQSIDIINVGADAPGNGATSIQVEVETLQSPTRESSEHVERSKFADDHGTLLSNNDITGFHEEVDASERQFQMKLPTARPDPRHRKPIASRETCSKHSRDRTSIGLSRAGTEPVRMDSSGLRKSKKGITYGKRKMRTSRERKTEVAHLEQADSKDRIDQRHAYAKIQQEVASAATLQDPSLRMIGSSLQNRLPRPSRPSRPRHSHTADEEMGNTIFDVQDDPPELQLNASKSNGPNDSNRSVRLQAHLQSQASRSSRAEPNRKNSKVKLEKSENTGQNQRPAALRASKQIADTMDFSGDDAAPDDDDFRPRGSKRGNQKLPTNKCSNMTGGGIEPAVISPRVLDQGLTKVSVQLSPLPHILGNEVGANSEIAVADRILGSPPLPEQKGLEEALDVSANFEQAYRSQNDQNSIDGLVESTDLLRQQYSLSTHFAATRESDDCAIESVPNQHAAVDTAANNLRTATKRPRIIDRLQGREGKQQERSSHVVDRPWSTKEYMAGHSLNELDDVASQTVNLRETVSPCQTTQRKEQIEKTPSNSKPDVQGATASSRGRIGNSQIVGYETPINTYSCRKMNIISFNTSGPQNQGTVQRGELKNSIRQRQIACRLGAAPDKVAAEYDPKKRKALLQPCTPQKRQRLAPSEPDSKALSTDANDARLVLVGPTKEAKIGMISPIVSRFADATRPENTSFKGSQGSRVQVNGSPIPVPSQNNRVFTSTQINDADDDFEVHPACADDTYTSTETFLKSSHENLSSVQNHRVLTLFGSTKQVPSSPLAPSQMLTKSIPHKLHPNGILTSVRNDDIVLSQGLEDPFLGVGETRENSFTRLLRESSQAKLVKRQQAAVTAIIDDPEQTLLNDGNDADGEGEGTSDTQGVDSDIEDQRPYREANGARKSPPRDENTKVGSEDSDDWVMGISHCESDIQQALFGISNASLEPGLILKTPH